MPACDDNLLPWKNRFTFGFGRGPYTITRNCFLGKDALQYQVDYAKQFFDTYKYERKFYSMHIIDSHEMTGELAEMTIDPLIDELINYLEKQGHLDKTIVHLYSDHGDHVNPIAFKTESGKIERFNPFYALMIPASLARRVEENLVTNTQRLTTAFDLFETNMEYLGYDRQYPNGRSLMKEVIPANATCKDRFPVDYEDECKCF